MFRVGQKVVCIDDSSGWASKQKLLTKNETYTIEYVNKVNGDIKVYGIYGEWNNSRFRPLDYDFVEEVIKQVKPQPETV